MIKSKSSDHGLDPVLVAAIAERETGGRCYMSRYEPDFKYLLTPASYSHALGISLATETMQQKTSWGIMQIMGAVARELGFKDYFPVLCQTDVGLEYGCKKLKLCIARYHGDIASAISAYNAGTAWKDETTGVYRNHEYVDGVLDNVKKLKETWK